MIDSRRCPRPTPGCDVQAAFVGSAMVLRLVHPNERVTVDRRRAPQINDGNDPTHETDQLSAEGKLDQRGARHALLARTSARYNSW